MGRKENLWWYENKLSTEKFYSNTLVGAFKSDDITCFEMLKIKSKHSVRAYSVPKPYVSMINIALNHYFTAFYTSERKIDGVGLPFVVKSRLLFILSIPELYITMDHPQIKEVKLQLEVTLYLAFMFFNILEQHHFYKI